MDKHGKIITSRVLPFEERQRAYRTHNPENVGNVDSRRNTAFNSWQKGVNAVANNLAQRCVKVTSTIMNTGEKPTADSDTVTKSNDITVEEGAQNFGKEI